MVWLEEVHLFALQALPPSLQMTAPPTVHVSKHAVVCVEVQESSRAGRGLDSIDPTQSQSPFSGALSKKKAAYNNEYCMLCTVRWFLVDYLCFIHKLLLQKEKKLFWAKIGAKRPNYGQNCTVRWQRPCTV